MESHVHSASTQLWDVIILGFNPYDPNSLTTMEAEDDQLNATILYMLRQAVPEDHQDSITLLKSAKEIWDCLDEMF